MESSPVTYARRIGLFSGTMLVVGGIIGSGIFLNPAIVAQRVGSARLIMATWALGALVALLGAFIFAELGARRPAAGGGYVYLREAFGPLPAFLYAWALLLAIATGAAAAVAVTFASYAAPLLGLTPGAEPWLAAGAIALLSVINVVGVRPGTLTQNVFTVLKLAAIAALVVSALIAPPLAVAAQSPSAAAPTPLVLAIGTALVPVLFAYGGWQQTNFVAEEMVDAERNLPRALVIGVVIVAVVYLAVNLTYLRALGVPALAASRAPAADVMGAYFGETGRRLIAAGIAVSTFGFLNLVILVTPRVYQAMARDGLFFARFAELHPRFRTPVAAIGVQGAWAIALLLSGSYGQLLDYVTFADWIFFGITAATLFVYRRRDAVVLPALSEVEGPALSEVEGPALSEVEGSAAKDGKHGVGTRYRAPFYPASVVLFCLACLYVVAGAIVSNPWNAARGALLLAAGVPVFLFWSRRARWRDAGAEGNFSR